MMTEIKVNRKLHDNGLPHVFEQMNEKGQLHGYRKIWDINGKLHIDEKWVNGQLHGVKIAYEADCKIAAKHYYINGKEVTYNQFLTEYIE
jgi:antitoxin component YwqK of YwqJK toxin-antitoxin module